MARKKKKKQPPVSLSPLTPEEALAGLMQVQPEQKEAPVDDQPEHDSEPEAGKPS